MKKDERQKMKKQRINRERIETKLEGRKKENRLNDAMFLNSFKIFQLSLYCHNGITSIF